MKKYQLIKRYPGLPANASRAVQTSEEWYKITNDKELDVFDTAKVVTIENSPEFWEEYKPFQYVTEDGITICDKNQTVYGYNLTSTSVGPTKAGNTWNKEDNAGGWIYFSTAEARGAYIEALKPKPVFKTVDGIYIYPDDEYYYVNADDFQLGIAKGRDTLIGGRFLKFSNNKNAKEWVLMNRPLITLRDIMEPSSTSYSVNLSDSNKGKLRAIAQQRLSLYNTKP